MVEIGPWSLAPLMVLGKLMHLLWLKKVKIKHCNLLFTGKSMSLILESTKPKYDNRLFIELRVQYMKILSSEHVVYTNCSFFLTFRTIYVRNMFSTCSELEFSCTKLVIQ